MKTLLHCPDIYRAYILKSHLESEGIPAVVVNENTAVYSLCPALENRGIRILVDEDDFARAVRIVEGVYRPAELQCPFCRNRQGEFTPVSPGWREILRSLFRGPRRRYRCPQCGKTFYSSLC